MTEAITVSYFFYISAMNRLNQLIYIHHAGKYTLSLTIYTYLIRGSEICIPSKRSKSPLNFLKRSFSLRPGGSPFSTPRAAYIFRQPLPFHSTRVVVFLERKRIFRDNRGTRGRPRAIRCRLLACARPSRRFIRIVYCYSTPLGFMGLFRTKGQDDDDDGLCS